MHGNRRFEILPSLRIPGIQPSWNINLTYWESPKGQEKLTLFCFLKTKFVQRKIAILVTPFAITVKFCSSSPSIFNRKAWNPYFFPWTMKKCKWTGLTAICPVNVPWAQAWTIRTLKAMSKSLWVHKILSGLHHHFLLIHVNPIWLDGRGWESVSLTGIMG